MLNYIRTDLWVVNFVWALVKLLIFSIKNDVFLLKLELGTKVISNHQVIVIVIDKIVRVRLMEHGHVFCRFKFVQLLFGQNSVQGSVSLKTSTSFF